MPHFKILIHEKDTPPVDDGATPGMYKGELDFTAAIILEDGTIKGDTSIMFRLYDSQGNHYIAQLTGNIFRAVTSAFNGADQRFKAKHSRQN